MILGLPAWVGNSILQPIGDCSLVEGCGEATLAMSRPSSLSERKLDALFMAGFPPKAGNRALISANF